MVARGSGGKSLISQTRAPVGVGPITELVAGDMRSFLPSALTALDLPSTLYGMDEEKRSKKEKMAR